MSRFINEANRTDLIMQIAFMVSEFPNTTQTFIQNQIVGLYDRNQEIVIYAESDPSSEAAHEVIEEYDLRDRTIYSSDPQSYYDGFRLLARTMPSLLFDEGIDIRIILSELMSGTSAPRRLSNLNTVSGDEKSDIYHAHFGTVASSFLPITKIHNKPFVASFYGWDASEALQSNPDRYNELFERADAITVLSEDMRDDLASVGCPKSKTHIQPLSIDTERFLFQEREVDDGPVRLLTVARFVEKKGIEYALEAVSSLDTDREVQYTIVGDGQRRDQIESKITDLGLTGVVDLRGWQPQSTVAELMAESHLFLLPSVTAKSGDKEGTPTVLLEAQSMGMPVVSTYHAGIPEIVEDGEAGILVPERDSQALIRALEELIAEPERWAELGKRGRSNIEETHSIEAVSNDLLELYRSLL